MRKYFILLAVSIVASVCHADTLNVVFTGDILLDRGVRRVIDKHGVDHLFTEGVDSVFRSAQVVVGNLECPATKIQSPVQKLYIFRGEPEWLEALKRHGITHLNLANNHSIDQGREGLIDTRQNIINTGITAIGAGANMTEAAEPVLLSRTPRNVWLVPSLRLALENYAYLPDKPCVSQEPMDSLLNRVHRLRKADSTAVIIVSLHWAVSIPCIPSTANGGTRVKLSVLVPTCWYVITRTLCRTSRTSTAIACFTASETSSSTNRNLKTQRRVSYD